MSDEEDKAFSEAAGTLPVEIKGVLGARSSVIPQDSGSASERKVFIGTHSVLDLGENSQGLIKLALLTSSETAGSIIDALGTTDVPDPTFHWVVIVGEYYHELIAGKAKMDPLFRITVSPAYQNGHYTASDFSHMYEVGLTSLTDQQIKSYAEQVIGAGGAIYDMRTNNCQHFVNRLLDKISPGHTVYKTLAPPAVKYTSTANSAKAAFKISSIPTIGGGPCAASRLYTGATDETSWGEAGDETRNLKVVEYPTLKAKAYMEKNTPLITVLKSDGKTSELRLKALEQLKGVPADKVQNLADDFKSKYEFKYGKDLV